METQWGWVGGRRTKGTIRPHCTEAVACAFECRRTQHGLASTKKSLSACNHTTIFNRSVLSEDIPPRVFFLCSLPTIVTKDSFNLRSLTSLPRISRWQSAHQNTSFESKRREKTGSEKTLLLWNLCSELKKEKCCPKHVHTKKQQGNSIEPAGDSTCPLSDSKVFEMVSK